MQLNPKAARRFANQNNIPEKVRALLLAALAKGRTIHLLGDKPSEAVQFCPEGSVRRCEFHMSNGSKRHLADWSLHPNGQLVNPIERPDASRATGDKKPVKSGAREKVDENGFSTSSKPHINNSYSQFANGHEFWMASVPHTAKHDLVVFAGKIRLFGHDIVQLYVLPVELAHVHTTWQMHGYCSLSELKSTDFRPDCVITSGVCMLPEVNDSRETVVWKEDGISYAISTTIYVGHLGPKKITGFSNVQDWLYANDGLQCHGTGTCLEVYSGNDLLVTRVLELIGRSAHFKSEFNYPTPFESPGKAILMPEMCYALDPLLRFVQTALGDDGYARLLRAPLDVMTTELRMLFERNRMHHGNPDYNLLVRDVLAHQEASPSNVVVYGHMAEPGEPIFGHRQAFYKDGLLNSGDEGELLANPRLFLPFDIINQLEGHPTFVPGVNTTEARALSLGQTNRFAPWFVNRLPWQLAFLYEMAGISVEFTASISKSGVPDDDGSLTYGLAPDLIGTVGTFSGIPLCKLANRYYQMYAADNGFRTIPQDVVAGSYLGKVKLDRGYEAQRFWTNVMTLAPLGEDYARMTFRPGRDWLLGYELNIVGTFGETIPAAVQPWSQWGADSMHAQMGAYREMLLFAWERIEASGPLLPEVQEILRMFRLLEFGASVDETRRIQILEQFGGTEGLGFDVCARTNRVPMPALLS